MRSVLCAALVLIAALPALAQQERREELLTNPMYAEKDLRPALRELTADEVEAGVLVVSARSYAFFGFNNPEVQLWLPDIDNSLYAEIEMNEPKLDGGIEYELERGLFDAETRMSEIRFLAADGEGPAELARASGTIRVRYPLAVRTTTVTAANPTDAVTIDGPFVELLEGAAATPPPFSPLQAVRAYDATGRRLEKANWSSGRYANGVKTDIVAFQGPVARVEVDSVARWVDLEIAYDLPAVPPLPASRAGIAPEGGDQRPAPTPDGRVTVTHGAPYDAKPVARPTPTPVATATPRPAPTPAPRRAEPAAEAPRPIGPPIAVRPLGELSEPARALGSSITALLEAVPDPPAIVQLVSSGTSMVSVSVSTPSGTVEEYTYRQHETSGPRVVDTRWLSCTDGLAPGALDLDLLPALVDDAIARIAKPGVKLSQLIVGQYPCGSAWINVSFATEGSVRYDGRGRPLRVER